VRSRERRERRRGGWVVDLLRVTDSLFELSIQDLIESQEEELHLLDLVEEHLHLV
jgi:hypothetical protein